MMIITIVLGKTVKKSHLFCLKEILSPLLLSSKKTPKNKKPRLFLEISRK